jgi:transcriptional repressor of dcmA and dcmR
VDFSAWLDARAGIHLKRVLVCARGLSDPRREAFSRVCCAVCPGFIKRETPDVPNPNDDLLDIKRAARLLQVSEVSLRRWTNSGRLPCLRVGGRRERRFRRSDLLAFLEVQSVRGRVEEPAGALHAHAPVDGHRAPLGAHLCGVYDSDEDRARLAVTFLADGLRAGDSCYLVAAAPVRAQIVEALERVLPRARDERHPRRLVQWSYGQSPQAQLRSYEREFSAAIEEGARHLIAVGNTSDFLLKSSADLKAYERGFSQRIAARFPLVTLCLYDARHSSGTDLLDALRRHPDSSGGAKARLLL